MPLAPGRAISRPVLAGLAKQASYDIRLYIEIGLNVADSRNRLKGYATTPTVLLLDSDIVLPTGALAAMHAGLEREGAGAVALRRGGRSRAQREPLRSAPIHVGVEAMLVRSSLLDHITFRGDIKDGKRLTPRGTRNVCCCTYFMIDAVRLGYKVRYLEAPRTRHLDDDRANKLDQWSKVIM